MTEEKIAVCNNCGHTWKPRNDTETTRRKCSKCKSEDISLTTGTLNINDDNATPAEILRFLDTPPETKDNAEQPKPTDISEETTQTEPTEPKPKLPTINPIIIAGALTLAAGIAGIVWFRKHTAKTRQTHKNKTEPEPEPTPAPTAHPRTVHRIAGL